MDSPESLGFLSNYFVIHREIPATLPGFLGRLTGKSVPKADYTPTRFHAETVITPIYRRLAVQLALPGRVVKQLLRNRWHYRVEL
jgi:hypothetical protein